MRARNASAARAGWMTALAAGLLLAMPAGAAGESRMQRTVTVSAKGSVVAKPDVARISAGAVTEAASAREALTANSALIEKLIEALKRAGIAPADLKTQSLNVAPRYTHNPEGRAPQIDGYSVHNELSVMVRDLGRLGTILDELVTLGANQIGGLSFEIAEPEKLEDEARKAAIANARRQASLYAEAAGSALGEIVAITEGAAAPPHPGPVHTRALAAAVPIEAGSERVEVSVTATWSLR